MSHPAERGMVRQVLAAAGRAVGRSRARASRRGTVLLMVIGVLAMMSIIALVYASIGQADRRGAASMAREARLDDQAGTIADYIAGVISADLFSSHFDAGSNRTFRESFDYPSSDEFAVSVTPGPDEVFFDPAGNGVDPWLASTEPAWIPIPGRTPPGAASDEDFLNLLDIPHLSNLAPDGRFVNLFALRNNFAAEPGTGTVAPGQPRMSELLTLFEDTGTAYPPGGSFLPDGTTAADLDIPAHWTANQIMLNRPAFDLDQTAGAPSPADETWPPYQYADADGDGMLDSRWFELVRFDDSVTPSRYTAAVRASGPTRTFIAAKVIDLSGLINANTATDFREPPGVKDPVGVLPAEVDIARLLTLQDSYNLYGIGYEAYEPRSDRRDYDYGPPPGLGFDEFEAQALGESAYMALDHARRIRGTPVNPMPAFAGLAADVRAEFYRDYGFEPSGGAFDVPTTWLQVARAFGVADELELRTYHGANDPHTLSPFEAAVAGRYSTGGPVPFCPLRSNRVLSVERGGRGNRLPAGQQFYTGIPNGLPDDDALLQAATDIRRLLTFHSRGRLLRPVELDGNMDDVLTAADMRLDIVRTLEGASTAGDTTHIRNLFGAYAHALLPYTSKDDRDSAWETGGEFEKRLTLSYGGRGADLALLFAAHMTANAVDMYDADVPTGLNSNEPTVLAVPFRTGAAMTPALTGSRLVDLDTIEIPGIAVTGRLDPTSTPGEPVGAYVFGNEAQPFLTEVAAFHMFTDTPLANGGDEDWDWTDTNNDFMVQASELLGKITINGDVEATNPDFLMQVVAFQVYNPFSEPVDLSNYYFQIGEMILEVPSAAGNPTLLPGERRTFFATNPGRLEIADRWMNASTTAVGTVDQWLEIQLGITAVQLDESELDRLKVIDGTPVLSTDVADFFAGAEGNVTEPENRIVLMWRKFGDPAMREDDILADRMHDPAPVTDRPTWDRRFNLAGGLGSVGDTSGGPEDMADTDLFDNTGFSITMYGTVRRPRDPQAGNPSNIPVGAIPMFCIEGWKIDGTSLNTEADDGVSNPDELTRSDFVSYGDTTFDGLITSQTTIGLGNHRLDKDPKLNDLDTVVLPADAHPLAISYDRLYPEIHLNNQKFVANPAVPDSPTIMRLGDMLLPMAVGTHRLVGLTANTPPTIADLAAQWTTLSEALAISTGHGKTPIVTLSPLAPKPMDRVTVDVLDRGHLRLDAFVPFVKENPPADLSLLWEYEVTEGDLARYPAIPMALNILNQFRPENYGSERNPVPGLININTAPLAVLRMLPMLTPETTAGWMSDANTARVAVASSIYPATQNQKLFDPAPAAGPPPIYDVAAMVKAYRDKTKVWTRPDPTGAATTAIEIDFSPPPAPPPGSAGVRNDKTRIPGLREQPGFAGVGELLAVMERAVDTNNRPTFTLAGSNLDNSIVRYGYSATTDWAGETSADITGVDSTSYPGTGLPPVAREPDEIINDYDEQLTIANAVLGSINTRSDVLCVWFIVHGYLPSDVEGLSADDPMLPSIARRYVMVVDRSNVVRKGEKPKILLFQEVPL